MSCSQYRGRWVWSQSTRSVCPAVARYQLGQNSICRLQIKCVKYPAERLAQSAICACLVFPQEMLDCWQVAGASAPINFAFMFEGEEENGSIGFREAVASNLGWFADAALVVISNTVWVGEKQPCLTYGMRGMITASIQVSHPGVWGRHR